MADNPWAKMAADRKAAKKRNRGKKTTAKKSSAKGDAWRAYVGEK